MTTIALNKLIPAKTNVRKTGAQTAIEELAASIAAHGLLTSLAVRKGARGRYTVLAGQRRYQALILLAGRGQIASDHPVLCQLVESGPDAAEIGLAENVVRVAMHPADQFEAFRALIDKGADIAGIAARFGVSEAIVTKRLKLGRVAPVILDAYRAGAIGLEQVQAFALSDDHGAQERVFAAAHGYAADPRSIRRALTEGEIPSSDPRLRFIGLEAYEAAGGPVRRDLFSAEQEGYAQDAALLDRLVTAKLAHLAETVREEGWSWVEARPRFDYEDYRAFRRLAPEQIALPEEEAAEFERLTVHQEELLAAQYDEDGKEAADVATCLETIEARLSQLENLAQRWTAEQMAKAGAILSLSQDGTPEIERGLVRQDDAAAPAGRLDAEEGQETPCPAPALPATLVEALTAFRTAALRTTLAHCPDVALAAVTHALACRAFYHKDGASCLQLALTERTLTGAGDTEAAAAFTAIHAQWAARLPADAGSLWDWCLRQTQDTLLALLAATASHAVDAVWRKGPEADTPALRHSDALAKALGFDIHAWFRPTAANFFGKVNRSLIMEALAEVGRPVRTRAWSKMKKADLAALAEREMLGTGWLPQPLRNLTDEVAPEETQPAIAVMAAA